MGSCVFLLFYEFFISLYFTPLQIEVFHEVVIFANQVAEFVVRLPLIHRHDQAALTQPDPASSQCSLGDEQELHLILL